jgi:hypothetical protein
MPKETIGAKFEEEEARRIEEYQEKEELATKSEALRQLTKKGLRGSDETRRELKIFATVAFSLGLVGVVQAWQPILNIQTTEATPYAALLTSVGLVVWYLVAIRPWKDR